MMWKKFLNLSRLHQIAVSVVLLHLIAVFTMTVHHAATRRLRPAKPISVRTIAPKPAPKAVVQTVAKVETARPSAQQKKPAPKPAAPAKTEIKSAAKTAAKSVAKPAPKTKETLPEAFPKNEKLQEIAESFQSLTSLTEEKTARPALPLPIPLSQVKTSEPTQETNPSFGEYLTAFLQSELQLPEQGDVKVRIAIDSFGKLIECEILDSRSKKNEEFLKNRLPELAYPCFNDFGITDATQTFTISFRNADH